MDIARIQYTFMDKKGKFVGKLYQYPLEHVFIPKKKSFGMLDFKFEFASIEKNHENGENWLYVIYKERK